MGRNSGGRGNKKIENKSLTRGLCPRPRKPGKGLINADKMKRAKPMPHFKICRRERGIGGFVY